MIKIEPTDKTEPGGDKPMANKDSSDSEASLTVPSSVAPSEQESSAIEGLLGLSELGVLLWVEGTRWDWREEDVFVGGDSYMIEVCLVCTLCAVYRGQVRHQWTANGCVLLYKSCSGDISL